MENEDISKVAQEERAVSDTGARAIDVGLVPGGVFLVEPRESARGMEARRIGAHDDVRTLR